MSSILAANVTFTPSGRTLGTEVEDNSGRYKKLKMAFGNSTLTYPTGGIPMSGLANWGFPYSIGSVEILDSSNADGYVYKWDAVNNKLRIYQSAGFTPAGTNTNASPPVFTGTAVVAAPLVEVTTAYAPAATTLYLRVYGH